MGMTINEIRNVINGSMDTAVRNVAMKVRDQLIHYIDKDFYDQYKPKQYERTYRFLNSVAEDITRNAARVFLDLDYKYDDVTAQEQAEGAAEGWHGTHIHVEGFYFWQDFENWCNENIYDMLRDELIKQGLEVK